MSRTQEAISKKLAAMFGKDESQTAAATPAQGSESHMTELSKQAIQGLQSNVGGGFSKSIWRW